MPKVRAFVAEDDALILLSMEMMLEVYDVEIKGSARSVGEAEEFAASIIADIAILDVNLDNKMVFPAADVLSPADFGHLHNRLHERRRCSRPIRRHSAGDEAL